MEIPLSNTRAWSCIPLEELKRDCVKNPTANRPTWLVYFEYVISLDGEIVSLEVESEFENRKDFYIVGMKDERGREVGLDELHAGQEEEIRSEALASAIAFEIFSN